MLFYRLCSSGNLAALIECVVKNLEIRILEADID